MTPFESLSVEVQEVIRDAFDITTEISMIFTSTTLRRKSTELAKQIEALWPEFGEGKEK